MPTRFETATAAHTSSIGFGAVKSVRLRRGTAHRDQDGIRSLLTDGVDAGFVQPEDADTLLLDDDPLRLLDRLVAWRAPKRPRLWLRPDET